MGLAMQIVYLGFPGSSAIEAEAGVQLLRLLRFSRVLSGCHLAIEKLVGTDRLPAFDVRLDLISISHDLQPLRHCQANDAVAAMRAAFDVAERELGNVAADKSQRATSSGNGSTIH